MIFLARRRPARIHASVRKTEDNRAWFLVLPVLIVVAFSAVVPLITVVNYSVQDILGPDQRLFTGFQWYREVLRNPEVHAAFGRQLMFSGCVLAIEIPLGIGVALLLPRSGRAVGPCLVLLALPLLIPYNVVGTIFQILCRTDIGLLGAALAGLGFDYNYSSDPFDAWWTVVMLDVWHWTPLVALLCYAALRSIPAAYYQAASIDGASGPATFRYIQLPKMKGVLIIAILLRFMDSFMIYTEPFVLTGGGPGNATTFLSQMLARMAVGQFDLGRSAAFSLVYFVMILTVSYVFYTMMTAKPGGRPDSGR